MAEDKGSTDNPSVPWRVSHRLVALVCAELAVHRPAQAPRANNRTIKRDRRKGEPQLWNFQLTRPVNVDCREEVRAWARSDTAGDPRTLTVRSHVRGHYKRQPHGPRSSLRKWIYVPPHQRGPDDAPLAVRIHKLGDDGDRDE